MNTLTSDQPNPGRIYDLYTGIFRPQIVRLAVQLDVLTPLAHGPCDAAAVAQACGCSTEGMTRLLDALVGMQVLTIQDDRYAVATDMATFLVRGRPAYAGDLILAWTGPAIWGGIHQALRSGEPQPFEEFHEQDAWLESYSEWRIASSQAMWQAAGIQPQPGHRRRLLDLACGCAIKSLALVQLDPDLHLTGIDTPRVLPVAYDLAARMGLTAQVEFVPADLLTTDLRVAHYDLCLLGQITDYLTPAQNQDLFIRVHAALRPGGTLVLDVPMTDRQPDAWTQIVSLLLWVNGGGGAHRFVEYCNWLEQAGFAQINRVGDRWVTAIKNLDTSA